MATRLDPGAATAPPAAPDQLPTWLGGAPDRTCQRSAAELVRWLMLPVLALAFALRVLWLDRQSLWYDEGLTAWYAGQPLPEMAARLAGDEHPPLYFALLGAWTALAGTSDFPLRWLSVAFGLLGIAATYALVARLAGRWAGIVAAALLTVAPLHLWYSQEVRGYAALLAFGTLALWALVRSLDADRPWRQLALLAAVNAAGLWTHLQFALIGVVEGLVVIGWTLLPAASPCAGRLRRGLWAAAALALGAALFLPWLPNVLGVLGDSDTYWSGRLWPAELLRQTALAWAVGDRLPALRPDALPAPEPWLLALLAALVGLGLLRLLLAGRVRAALTLALWLAVPCAVIAVAVVDRPKFAPRYLLLVLPALLGLAGAAVAGPVPRLPRLGRRVGWLIGGSGVAAALALVGFGAAGAWAQATDQRLWREDYRGAAAYLERVARPDDAVVLLSGYSQVVFNHYYHGPAPVFALPDETVPHLRRAIRWEGLAALNRVVAGRHRVWVVEWQANVLDPSGLVHQQLALAGHRADAGAAFHGLDLNRYDLDGSPRFPIAFDPDHPLGHRFGDGLELVGYDLAPGHWAFNLTLYWRVLTPPDGDLTGFVHLLSPREHLYGGVDRPPINPVYPTSRWHAGDLLRDEYELPVARHAPPGTYRIEVGLYDSATHARLPITTPDGLPAGDRLLIGEVSIGPEHVQRPPEPPHEFDPPIPAAPGVALIGWEPPEAPPAAGSELTATLFWYCGEPPTGTYQSGLALRDAAGRTAAELLEEPADGLFPTPQWRPGQTSRDTHTLSVRDTPPGTYRLFALMQVPGAEPTAIEVGPVEVR